MSNYSIIKFGSQLNGYFDKYSDKDLLIVTESLPELRERYHEFTNLGWSVSGYTYDKLNYLSQKGSLFIDHLKKDAEIVFDVDGRFAKILESHISKSQFDTDIRDCCSYFDIIRTLPDNHSGLAWFCDCFYVGLRNYLVFKAAQNRSHEFSYLKLIEQLLQQDQLCEADFLVLKELRVIKFNYREDIFDSFPSKSYVHSLISIGKKLGLLNDVSVVEVNEFQCIITGLIFGKNYNGYQRLRMIEGMYCAKDIAIPGIKRIVSNPQFYSSKLIDDDYLENLLQALNIAENKDFLQLISKFETDIKILNF